VVDADPANARGYAALADANVAMGDYCYGTHMPQIYFGRARAYAEKALALDPDSAEAHATLGFLSMESGDAASAMSELRRSLAVDAANSTTHTWYAIALTQSGRPEEALRELQAAQRLDPLSVVASVWLSSEAYRRGQFGEAVRYARQTLELSPRRLDALRILGESYEAQGDFKSAIATFKQIGAVGAYYHPYAAELLARAYELDGQKALARIQLAYARTHLREHRTATEDASGLLFRRNIGALVLFRTDPNRLDVDELVYSKG
jgi:tetratricopeptide (TPR) repeat protein